MCVNNLMERNEEEEPMLFSVLPSNRTRGNGDKLKKTHWQ